MDRQQHSPTYPQQQQPGSASYGQQPPANQPGHQTASYPAARPIYGTQSQQSASYHTGASPASQPQPYNSYNPSEASTASSSSVAPGQPGTMPITQSVTAFTNEPASYSFIELGKRYRLEVVQQPQRARMCGFGDKDRRPITPPPCIRLIITDAVSGKEIDVNDVDSSLFVLNVDLWSADGVREVNLVRQSTAPIGAPLNSPSNMVPYNGIPGVPSLGPSVYSALPVPTGHPNIVRDPQFPYHLNQPDASVMPPPAQPYGSQAQQRSPNTYQSHHQLTTTPLYAVDSDVQFQQHLPQGQGPVPRPYHNMPVTLPQHQQTQSGENPMATAGPVYNPPSKYPDPPNHHVYYHTGNSVHAIASNTIRPTYENIPPTMPASPPVGGGSPVTPGATGMFTRNLIGSLAASAFRLTDPNDKTGIWFVLQDLSVRTEGNFRLRFSFVNVGAPGRTPNGDPSNQISINPAAQNATGRDGRDGGTHGNGFSSSSANINRTRAPILASCFSDVFQVFSAKKFPGVVESTALSKCFATQGIKIPIRKDAGEGRRPEYDDD